VSYGSKKECNTIAGTWENDENDIIEIKTDGVCRFLKGTESKIEIVGFKKVIWQLNNVVINGEIVTVDCVQWADKKKWKRHSNKGCLIM